MLDNLEDLMPQPSVTTLWQPEWQDAEVAAFFAYLTTRLTGQGRAILTCRYRPENFAPQPPGLACLPMPDFTESDFFKYLHRHARVAQRISTGDLPRDLLEKLHVKLGATPRFIDQICAVLETIDANELEEQLSGVAEGLLEEKQQGYVDSLFLPHLLEALSAEAREALSRLALLEVPLPLDGVAQVTGVAERVVEHYISRWLQLSLAQRFGEKDELPLYSIYPLQRAFLTDASRHNSAAAQATHTAAAAFFQEAYEQNRGEELRLPFIFGLWACLHHATLASDTNRRRWATLRLAYHLQCRAEFKAALVLVEETLKLDRHPRLLKASGDSLASLGRWQEAHQLYQASLENHQVEDGFGGALLHNLGTIDMHEGNYVIARANFLKALKIEQAIGNRDIEAATWLNLGSIDMKEGNYAEARTKFCESLKINQSIGDHVGEAAAWHQVGAVNLNEGSYAEARVNFLKALDIEQASDDRAGEASSWHSLASIDLIEGNYTEARPKFLKSLEIKQSIGDSAGEAATIHQLASIDLREGNYAEARINFRKVLEANQAIGNRAGEAATWHQLGTMYMNEGNYAEARINLRKALEMRQTIGDYAGEAVTWYQIGAIAWQNNRREVGLRLGIISYGILATIGAGEQQQAWSNVTGMTSALNLDQTAFDAMHQEVLQSYQQDGGAELLRQAFEGL